MNESVIFPSRVCTNVAIGRMTFFYLDRSVTLEIESILFFVFKKQISLYS